MLAFIEGNVEYISTDKVIISNGGIGYNIYMPSSHMSAINVNEEIKVFTYLNVREDAMQLFGFLNMDDYEVFKLLLAVSGIGPKGALAILSTLTTDDLRVAVLSEDAKAISKAPGIGGKTAQRVIIELKDKLNLEDILEKENTKQEVVTENNGISEAVMALVSLGYSQTESLKVVKSIDNVGDMDVETIIKSALKKIY